MKRSLGGNLIERQAERMVTRLYHKIKNMKRIFLSFIINRDGIGVELRCAKEQRGKLLSQIIKNQN